MSARPQDLQVLLPDRPGALADLGQTLGSCGVSLEGGGVFTHDGHAVAHYPVDDGPPALAAVTAAGLGALARMLGDAGAHVLVQYSDHAGNLVLLVPDEHTAVCRDVIARWEQG